MVEERDSGAANAASEVTDETAAQLVLQLPPELHQARCYKLLDMM